MNTSPELQQALQHLESGAPGECVRLCNAILAERPGLIEALYLRGCARYQTGDIAESVGDLEIVHRTHPEHLHAAYYCGRSLRAAARFEDALEPLQAALGEKDLEVHARYELAVCLTRLRRRPEAIKHYRAILRQQPANAQVAANLASLLERENDLEEARSWTRRALDMDPANETARMTHATLDRRMGRFADAARRLRRLTTTVDHPMNLSLVWNQLGQSLERMEKWDDAFNAFGESNRILKTCHPDAHPDPRGPQGMQTLARVLAWLKTDPLAAWSIPATPDAGGLAFLVGFPRSGTTLLDRMLSAHPEIEVLEEKNLFAGLHLDWSEPGTLEAMAGVSDAQIRDARETYRRDMARHRRHPERTIAIDKLPLNLSYLFLIYRLFPEAPVIFLQRHPLDVCISCYFQSFELAGSMGYFLDLRDTARYYDAVMQVAALSLERIGNPVYRLRYEDVVRSPRERLKTLLDFLHLEWDDSVLDNRQSILGRASDTPSYQQVSEPLYTRSIGRWRHYSDHLEACLPVLEGWVRRFGYELSR